MTCTDVSIPNADVLLPEDQRTVVGKISTIYLQTEVCFQMVDDDRNPQNQSLELPRVISDWHEYSGIPIEEITSDIASYEKRIADEWRAMVTTAEDNQISKFYGESNSYVYDILSSYTQSKFHSKRRNNLRIQAFIKHLARGRRVNALEFGGGTGELCLLMWEAGATVTYCDLRGRISEFAAWRFKKYNAGIKTIYSRIDCVDLPESSYDLVVSDAVLEHLKVEHLRGFVDSMSRSLKPTGYLYLLWDPTYYAANPTHILGLSDLDVILSDSGLLRIGENVYARAAVRRYLLLARLISPLFSVPSPFRGYLLRFLSTLEKIYVT